MGNTLVLAPIKGYTDPVWRSCYFDHFEGIDKVVTPFLLLSEHNKAKSSYFPQFFPEIGSDIEVVPQFLVKKGETVIHASNILKELGIKEYNINMGCPAPAIVKKSRGSGLLNNLDIAEKLLDDIIPNLSGDLTVKIRTGVEDSSLIKPVVKLLNRYPLKEVIVHPRYARQLYNGKPDMDAFSYAYYNSDNPVSYNGDIYSLDDFNEIKNKFPDISSYMIGRGVLQDPFLPVTIKTGIKPSDSERKSRTLDFIYDLESRFNRNYHKGKIGFNRLKASLIYMSMYYDSSIETITKVKRSQSLDQILEIMSLN